jgi:hypothetical protein
MKVQGLLFACSLGLFFVLILAFIVEEQPRVEKVDLDSGKVVVTHTGHGIAHPQYSTMLRGGSGKDRHENILWLGWGFGAITCTMFVALLGFGARRKDVVGPIKIPITIGGIIYFLIWSALVWSYRGYMNGDTEGRFLALPYPTAWMIYGIWLFPAFFIILFIVNYEKYFWNDDIEAEFNAILEAKKNREEGTA